MSDMMAVRSEGKGNCIMELGRARARILRAGQGNLLLVMSIMAGYIAYEIISLVSQMVLLRWCAATIAPVWYLNAYRRQLVRLEVTSEAVDILTPLRHLTMDRSEVLRADIQVQHAFSTLSVSLKLNRGRKSFWCYAQATNLGLLDETAKRLKAAFSATQRAGPSVPG